MRIALVAAGGFDESARDRVTPRAPLARRNAWPGAMTVIVYVLRYHDRPGANSPRGRRLTTCDRREASGVSIPGARLGDAARRADSDVVHGYQALPSGLAAALAGWRLSQFRRWRRSTAASSMALPDVGAGYGLQRRPRQRFAVSAAARLATVITVCSQYQQQLGESRGITSAVIPIGVDRTSFPPAEPSDGPPWTLLHVASLNPVKDQATLVGAVARSS